MGTLQEIAEELVNLTVKEVNELANVVNHDMMQPEIVEDYDKSFKEISTPRKYGESIRNKHWKRQKHG